MQNIIEFYLKRIRIRKMTIKWIKTKQFLLEKYLKSKINEKFYKYLTINLKTNSNTKRYFERVCSFSVKLKRN